MIDINSLDWQKMDGLLPAIIQDAEAGHVLMLGYMNAEALARTIQMGKVTFYSRSKQRLWTKGETSGNVLELVDIAADCDNDALLIAAHPTGPTCHLNTWTCFGSEARFAIGFLDDLARVIRGRRDADFEKSYTSRLLSDGPKRIAQKLGEEGVETALAAVAGDKAELANEAADLVYHLLVLLEACDASLADVIDVLAERHAVSP